MGNILSNVNLKASSKRNILGENLWEKYYTKHSWDQHMQKRTGFLDTGIGVHFDQPNMEILIDDEIITKDFKAIFPIILIESSFCLYCKN